MSLAGRFKQVIADVKAGAKKGEQMMAARSGQDARNLVAAGGNMEAVVPQYRFSVFDPRYAKDLKQGINLQTAPGGSGPVQNINIDPVKNIAEGVGAYGARLVTDLGSDSSRQYYWRYNHPMALAEGIRDKAIGEQAASKIRQLSPTKQAVVNAASLGVPAALGMGVFDVFNPGELGRPKGFAQNYAETGSDDRRQTSQPGLEVIERFAMGRRGRPLKYETAKEDIPDLTKERYANYMRNYYQDKGITGLGLVKGTMENLEGVPEARIVGFPVGAPFVGAVAGGVAGIRQAAKGGGGVRRLAGRGALGAGLGLAAGIVFNAAIAQANRPDPASTVEYATSQGRPHLPTMGLR